MMQIETGPACLLHALFVVERLWTITILPDIVYKIDAGVTKIHIGLLSDSQ